MPEGIEIELYRRAAAETVGRRIVAVAAPDPWFLKRGLDAAALDAAARGATVAAARRHGKLLLLDLERRGRAVTIGLRFGMTGRLLVDGTKAIDRLEYGSARYDPAWERVRFSFARGGYLAVDDARRLGGVELEPDEAALGPDAFSLSARQLDEVLDARGAPLKARLMDQTRIAGLGNLLTDEILWRAGLDPARPASSVTADERRVLRRTIAGVLRTLTRRGGSHTGDLQEARMRGGACPRDGAPLARRTIAGRTTYSCPVHQR